MGNQYRDLRNKQAAEVNAFPMFFAFSDKQFAEGMEKLGLGPEDTDKIYRLGNTGGYYRKSDASELRDMFARHEREFRESIEADTTGDGFIFEMFNYELANHEYNYTRDPGPTLDALGLSLDEIKASPALLHGWKKAVKRNG